MIKEAVVEGEGFQRKTVPFGQCVTGCNTVQEAVPWTLLGYLTVKVVFECDGFLYQICRTELPRVSPFYAGSASWPPCKGFVSKAQHTDTAGDIYSRTPDETQCTERKQSSSLFSEVWSLPGFLLHPQAWTTKIIGEKSTSLSDEAGLKDDVTNMTVYCRLGMLQMSVKLTNLANFKNLNSI